MSTNCSIQPDLLAVPSPSSLHVTTAVYAVRSNRTGAALGCDCLTLHDILPNCMRLLGLPAGASNRRSSLKIPTDFLYNHYYHHTITEGARALQPNTLFSFARHRRSQPEQNIVTDHGIASTFFRKKCRNKNKQTRNNKHLENHQDSSLPSSLASLHLPA